MFGANAPTMDAMDVKEMEAKIIGNRPNRSASQPQTMIPAKFPQKNMV